MRLIDADVLKSNLTLVDEKCSLQNTLLDIIDKHVTAYDIDKVVEQLEKMLENDVEYKYKRCRTVGDEGCAKYIACEYCILQGALEIIKAGGKNE